MTEVFPHLTNIEQHSLEQIDIEKTAEWVFIATPSGVSGKLVPSLIKAGRKRGHRFVRRFSLAKENL